jgi:hypothetical protein
MKFLRDSETTYKKDMINTKTKIVQTRVSIP